MTFLSSPVKPNAKTGGKRSLLWVADAILKNIYPRHTYHIPSRKLEGFYFLRDHATSS